VAPLVSDEPEARTVSLAVNVMLPEFADVPLLTVTE
jgi:hypothetical protein